MNAQVALGVRRAVAAVIGLATVVVAAEIPVHAHRNAQCLDVSSMGCERWIYSGTPYWAVAVAVVVGLLGLSVATLVYRPRPLSH